MTAINLKYSITTQALLLLGVAFPKAMSFHQILAISMDLALTLAITCFGCVWVTLSR